MKGFVNVQRWIGLLIGISLVAGCSHEPESKSAPDLASDDVGVKTVETVEDDLTSVPSSIPDRTFPFQSAPLTTRSSSLPAPNLIPPTTTPERLPQVTTGRDDPFSSLPVSPTVTFRNRTTTSPLSVPAAPSIVTVPAPTSTQTLPTLPSLEAPALGTTEPFPLIATPPLAPPSRLAEAIEISGVVEVGGKMSVIVHVPDERSSRYATVGDYLANGKVLIKRVEMGTEPTVILEEDGLETIRYVGSSSSLAGLL